MKRSSKKTIVITGIAILGLLIAFICVAVPKNASPYYKVSVFARVLAHIERDYVETVDGKRLIEGAIRGMLRALDPHSAYYNNEEFQILQEDTRGNFAGVGLEVGIKDNVLTVISPIEDSPAQKAGILPGDQIIKIQGKPTRNMNIEDTVSLMRGKKGTTVTISIKRENTPKLIETTIKRDVIQLASVVSELVAPGFPKIWIRSFQDKTAVEVKNAVKEMTIKGGGLNGIILDLRRNPGGLLDQAVKVSDLFLNSGDIVSTKGRDGYVFNQYKAQKRGTLPNVPIVVIIDRSSASAAEIVAGALKDNSRALLVGMKTFGKGSIQSLIPLPEGEGLKLTVGLYYTPSGLSIQAEGISPDVLVESKNPPEPDAETKMLMEIPTENDLPGHLEQKNKSQFIHDELNPQIDDYQLRMAFQVLKGLVKTKRLKTAPRK